VYQYYFKAVLNKTINMNVTAVCLFQKITFVIYASSYVLFILFF